MQLANKLWESGIKAEFGFKPNPKMGDQLGYALEQGIPFMILFGDDELQQGVVKVGIEAERTERSDCRTCWWGWWLAAVSPGTC
jgi:histidyl-tRNA synthetase